MIITRTPLRIEFVGGGTDMNYFYKLYPGRVLNMTVNKFVYVALNKKFDDKIRVSYSITENVDTAADLEHTRVKAALKYAGISKGLEIVSIADVPGKGTGLGSSSSFTVGLVQGLSSFQGKKLSRVELAEAACHIEIGMLGDPIGKQDQYAAVFGGLNFMRFNKDGRVDVIPLFLEPRIQTLLARHLLTFYTGKGHSAADILTDQKSNLKVKIPYLRRMSDLVPDAVASLEKGQLKKFAEILETEWTIKKNLSSKISDETLETMYQKAKKAGAWGGRVSGAGGGGFMILIAPPETHTKIRQALHLFQETSFSLVQCGSQTIHAE